MTLHGLLTAFTPDQFITDLLAMIVFGLIIDYVLRGVSPHGAVKLELAR